MTVAAFKTLALSFPGTFETPHFERSAFKVTGKRIFATLLEADQTVNIPLRMPEQKAFCELDEVHIFPVPNKWGLQGWTTFEIRHQDEAVMREALMSAYNDVMQPKPKRKR
jgi:hypothetical protein